jgi:hypothetical protein
MVVVGPGDRDFVSSNTFVVPGRGAARPIWMTLHDAHLVLRAGDYIRIVQKSAVYEGRVISFNDFRVVLEVILPKSIHEFDLRSPYTEVQARLKGGRQFNFGPEPREASND